MSIEKLPSAPDHRRISPTAKMVSYYRTFSDIPYAKDISVAIGGKEEALAILGDDLSTGVKIFAPFFEARYKCFQRYFCLYKNVIELAVGTSIERGLFISNNAENCYIGTDLPEMITEIKPLLARFAGTETDNHFLEPVNAVSFEEMAAAAGNLGDRRNVLIMNEGLLGYLSMEEQAECAENVRRILQTYGGRWVTTDVYDLESNERLCAESGSEFRFLIERTTNSLNKLTGRIRANNYFLDANAAIRFFNNIGFEVERRPIMHDGMFLKSMHLLWNERDKKQYAPLLENGTVWVMSLK